MFTHNANECNYLLKQQNLIHRQLLQVHTHIGMQYYYICSHELNMVIKHVVTNNMYLTNNMYHIQMMQYIDTNIYLFLYV